MNSTLLASLYKDHVAHLVRSYSSVMERTGFDAIVIHSGALKKRTEYDDQYWPLRATPHFQHWLPLAQPDCVVTVVAGKKPKLYWPVETSFWEKQPAPELSLFEDHFEVDRSPQFAPPASGRIAFIGEERSRAEAWGIEHENPKPLLKELDHLRSQKTAYEIECLAEANRRAALGHTSVLQAFREGSASELELHLRYLGATKQDDHETPYKNIVALDENGATLHHVTYGKTAPKGESLLLDAGATFLGYCSDITRTWVKGRGEAANIFESLLEKMEEMQIRLCDHARVGRPYEELHNESHREVSRILADAKIVRLSPEEIDSKGISRHFYPHGLGHSLGLQCHDVGCAEIKPKSENPFLRNTSPIEEAQVFTIEPGLYFIQGLLKELREGEHAGAIDWKLVDALSPLGGIRIEDDLVIGKAGSPARNLTREVLPSGAGR